MKSKTSLSLTPFLERLLLTSVGFNYPFDADVKKTRKLADNVKALSDRYISEAVNSENKILKDKNLIHAYTLYYLPVNLVKLFPVLDELVRGLQSSFLKGDSFSILDLGCGPGTFILGFLEYLSKNLPLLPTVPHSIHLWGIDKKKENLVAAEKMTHSYIDSCPSFGTIEWNLHFKQFSLESSQLHGTAIPKETMFDVIIAGNVITELSDKKFTGLLKIFEKNLSANGFLVIIDPGTKHSSRNLIELRNSILHNTSLNLYGPCPSTGQCPVNEQDKRWCHEKITWTPPAAVQAVDAITGFTKEKGIKYSYFSFVKKKKCLSSLFPEHPPEKIWRVISYLIKNKGEERLFVCNGLKRIMLRKLHKNSSHLNFDFSKTHRGDIVFFDACKNRDSFLDITEESIFQIL